MRAIGIDFGERRIGLALSDPEGRFALPHGVVERASAPSPSQADGDTGEDPHRDPVALVRIGLDPDALQPVRLAELGEDLAHDAFGLLGL